MRTLSSDVQAAIASGLVVLVTLYRLDFDSGVVALNSSNWRLVWDGVTYPAASGLGAVRQIEDGPGEVRGLEFSMSGISASQISLALDAGDEWQGCAVSVLTAILDPDTYEILEAMPEWTGYGDTMALSEDGQTVSITATAESSAVDLLRGSPSTYTDADQQALFAGDLAFDKVVSQSDKPIVWPAKSFFTR